MSESTPAAKSDGKSATENSETKSAAETPGESGASSKGGSAPARPISYFSSVSTDQYRAGWDNIFGKKADRRRSQAKGKR